jgi:hypothetical protein
MRRLIVPALVAAALTLTACSSSDDQAPAPKVTSAEPSESTEPTFDAKAALHESWVSARDTYPADLKLDICEAAKKGGEADVKALLTDSDRMPFVVDHPDYDAGQWVIYCQ